MAFTDYETEQLRKALLKETRRCAVTLGMKKTSVDQLTKAVGIAKGSFYKFYESKEMLFFAVLEGIHAELYGIADHALSETDGLPPSERAAKAVLAVCRRLSDTGRAGQRQDYRNSCSRWVYDVLLQYLVIEHPDSYLHKGGGKGNAYAFLR